MRNARRITAGVPSAPHSARGGVSLLEVLISIFVLSVGLLGVAAMLPVGRYEIVEGAKADRSAILGRAGLREVKVRRMLEYYQYDFNDPSSVAPLDMWDPSGVATSVATGTSGYRFVLIDPLYLRRNAQATSVASPNDRFPNTWAGGMISMPRVDLRTAPIGSPTMFMRATVLPEEIFVSHDDLLFDIPREAGERPDPVYTTTGVQQYDGNYSYMVMARYDTGNASASDPDMVPRATVWVIVFYKRKLDAVNNTTNAERVSNTFTFTGGGLSGGDATIRLQDPADAERLKPNEWLFVAGGSGSNVTIGAWYRIINAADHEGDDYIKYVTLSGPDWPVDFFNGSSCQAVLLGGVVNVFSETVELNTDLMRIAKP